MVASGKTDARISSILSYVLRDTRSEGEEQSDGEADRTRVDEAKEKEPRRDKTLRGNATNDTERSLRNKSPLLGWLRNLFVDETEEKQISPIAGYSFPEKTQFRVYARPDTRCKLAINSNSLEMLLSQPGKKQGMNRELGRCAGSLLASNIPPM